jgi:hypothetical protein
MQVRSVIDRLLDQVERGAPPSCSTRLLLPAKGTSIEVQWTVQDENCLKWFTAVVVKPDVTRREARQEKRLDRLVKCHQIRYTAPPNEVEWVFRFFSNGLVAPPYHASVQGLPHPRAPWQCASPGPSSKQQIRRSRGTTRASELPQQQLPPPPPPPGPPQEKSNHGVDGMNDEGDSDGFGY